MTNLPRSGRLMRALAISGRNGLLIVACAFTAVQAKHQLPVPAFSGLVLMTLAMLFWRVRLADRRGEEVNRGVLLALFVVAAFVLAYLRSLATDTGYHTHYDYVINADRFLTFGVVPTLWLQRHFFSPSHVGFLDLYCTVVYFSYYAMPLLTAVMLW